MCRTVRFQGTPLYWVATGEIGKAMTLSHSGFTWQICHNPVITKVQRIYGLNRLSPRKLLPLCHTFSQCVPALMQLLHTEQLCRHCAWNTFLTDSRVHLIRVSQQRTARKNRWVHTHVPTKPQRMKAIVSSGNTLPRYNLTKRDLHTHDLRGLFVRQNTTSIIMKATGWQHISVLETFRSAC